MTSQISPEAQAVLDAYRSTHLGINNLVAAFRAAVNEAAPEKTIEDIDYVHQHYVEGYKDALYEILSIANELVLGN